MFTCGEIELDDVLVIERGYREYEPTPHGFSRGRMPSSNYYRPERPKS